MKSTYFPIVLVVLGGVIYQLSQKMMPRELNPYFAILLAYATGVVLCVAGMMLEGSVRGALVSGRGIPWAAATLGAGALMIEIGFLLAYRRGWNMGTASMMTNILIALVLLPIGMAVFEERITARAGLGILCCSVGLYLITKK